MVTMPTNTQHTDILIIGAGLAGLSAASKLNKLDVDMTIVDKGRGIGGRLAGRRIGDASFDHGAQFMTTRDPRFVAQVKQWLSAGVAEEWYSSFPGQPNSHARYRGVPTMTAIAKHLAVGLNIQKETKALSVAIDHDNWVVELDNGRRIIAKALLITSPVPQTLDLLASSDLKLTASNQARLERINYESCIAVMAILDQPSFIDPPGALAFDKGPIAWISDNLQKGVSVIPSVTIHGSGDFSHKHFGHKRDKIAQQLINAAKPYLGANVVDFEVHGWRYSKPVVVDPSPCMVASEATELPTLVLAGDAFAGPRVEGAVISGWAAADFLTSSFR
ncbi:MAG: NAD(P)-binding protein [Porticoccaceae bacterium]|jgi:renalase|nr:NAD(P)-binding protein [Porticoccaceae bacterium]